MKVNDRAISNNHDLKMFADIAFMPTRVELEVFHNYILQTWVKNLHWAGLTIYAYVGIDIITRRGSDGEIFRSNPAAVTWWESLPNVSAVIWGTGGGGNAINYKSTNAWLDLELLPTLYILIAY